MLDNLVIRKKRQYDLYLFDAAWTPKYCSLFIDLSKEFSKSHIKYFNDSILKELNQCGDKIAGLPISVAYEALYSNTGLLKKYNKEIPKTWQQLYEAGKEILEKERAEGNTDLIGYNGVFGDAEMGICSAYGLLYSSRKTHDSPLPELTSETALNAALFMKKIKDEVEIIISLENITESVVSVGFTLDYDKDSFEIENIENCDGWYSLPRVENVVMAYTQDYQGTDLEGNIIKIKLKLLAKDEINDFEIGLKNIAAVT